LVLRPRQATAPNQAPTAVLRLDSIDETNRVATLSDGGSHDPDGTLQSWRIAWGDGKEDNLSSIPQKTAHTYAAEGNYTISLWCVDNLGATSSPPAVTNITFDFLKRQKALADAEAKRQADAKLAADRLKEEEARKEAARLEQERQRKMELAALEAQKAREQELEATRKAEEELARQKAAEAAKPPPTPLGAAVDGASSRTAAFTPPGYTLGQFQIIKEKNDGRANDGNFLVILVARCINFPGLPTPPTDWQIDGKAVNVQSGRVRASLSPGEHQVKAIFKSGQTREIKADVTVEPTGECEVVPRN
jgi:PKD repeat protein